MSPEERRERADGLKRVIHERTPADWIEDQRADIEIARKAREQV